MSKSTTLGSTAHPSPLLQELQAMASGWYETGTEIIFACGGSMFQSVAAAASLTMQLLSVLTLTSPSSLTLLSPPL